MITFNAGCRYAMVIPTSMGVRLTPLNGQPFHCSDTFRMQATSAESNVGSVASYLGLPVKILTAFVKDSPVSRFIKDNLGSRHMDYEGPEFEQGGPWGYRHQMNLADSGAGSRGPRVANDRAGEASRDLSADDFDLDRVFGEEGVQLVHMSGLIAALSPKTSQLCLDIASKAREYGTKVSFDLNFRKSMWEGRQEELSAAFREIAEVSDVLIGNEEDFQLCLGIEGPGTGGENVAEKIEGFKEMIGRVRQQFPKSEVFATTLREVVNANTHRWGGIVSIGDAWNVVGLEEEGDGKPSLREIGVVDRIGGGDSFVGGLLYGLLRGWDGERCARFAWASGALTVTLLTDYCQPADEEQIWSVWEGNARVKR